MTLMNRLTSGSFGDTEFHIKMLREGRVPARIKVGAIVGEDRQSARFPNLLSKPIPANTIFYIEVRDGYCDARTIGHGIIDSELENAYGNGSLFVEEKDLVFIKVK